MTIKHKDYFDPDIPLPDFAETDRITFRHINEIRTTHSFHLGPDAALDLGKIAERYGRELIAVAHDAKSDDASEYTIRLANESGIYDARVRVGFDDRVVETLRKTVLDFAETDRILGTTNPS